MKPKWERLLDSAAEKPDNEPLTDDEWLAILIWCGYTDEKDMLDLEAL